MSSLASKAIKRSTRSSISHANKQDQNETSSESKSTTDDDYAGQESIKQADSPLQAPISSSSTSTTIQQIRQSARRGITRPVITNETTTNNTDVLDIEAKKAEQKVLNNNCNNVNKRIDNSNLVIKTRKQNLLINNKNNEITGRSSSITTIMEDQNSSIIANKAKKKPFMNKHATNSLSLSFNSAISKSSTSNIITRKRHLSISTDLSNSLKLTPGHEINIENINEDSNSSGNMPAPTLSSSSNNLLGEPAFCASKRFKYKHKDYDKSFDSLSSSCSNFANLNSSSNNLLALHSSNSKDVNLKEMQSNYVDKEELNEADFICPVENCDSNGHLDGVSTRHWSFDTCPIYFGMSFNECNERKLDIEKRTKEVQVKVEQINENRKNLRSKPQTEAQISYLQSLNNKLKDKIKSNEHNLKTHLCDRIFNPELMKDIKNITTSTLLNSVSIGINPPPQIITSATNSKASRLANNKLINSNILFNCLTSNSSLKPSLVDDLEISKFELDMFKDALVASNNKKLENTKPTNSLCLLNKNNKKIQFSNYEIETWCKSPYPDDYWQLDKIFICQYCLIYLKSDSALNRHLDKCLWRHPPGREIYRKDKLSFFEVDGKFNKSYCQNLCLIAKLFLDHKTLYYDVEPFLFYILTKYNETNGSFEMIGYFSKEKQSVMNYNLSCILILPPFMNHSYGKLLIDFSYLLSREEEKYGSPERPLSDLGLISYRNYWKTVLLNYLSKFINESEISIKDASLDTGIVPNDIISTLQFIGLVKYWKGKHVIIKDMELIEKYVQKFNQYESKVDPNCLQWTPYVWQTIINESDMPVLSVFASNKHN